MSLLITFNGQFKPYRSEIEDNNSNRSLKVRHVSPIFKEVLERYMDKSFATDIYNKIQEHVRVRVYARDIMHSPVKSLKPEDTINEGIFFMEKNRCHHIPIVDKGILVGVVSDRSLLNALSLGEGLEAKLFSVMNPKVITGQGHTVISEIARVMVYEQIHSLPIIDSKAKLIGIVTATDILRFLTTSFPVEFYG